jgi:uncharacterized OsmC-like protein
MEIPMDDQWRVNTVTTTTTHVHGRTLNSVGVHHFIIDGSVQPKNEEIASMDAFLAGISSCATHLMEDFAREESIPLQRATVTIVAARRATELNRFDHIDLSINLLGPTLAQAEHLVERFKGR